MIKRPEPIKTRNIQITTPPGVKKPLLRIQKGEVGARQPTTLLQKLENKSNQKTLMFRFLFHFRSVSIKAQDAQVELELDVVLKLVLVDELEEASFSICRVNPSTPQGT